MPSASTIQVGKSTFTRCICLLGLRAAAQSTCAEMSSPASKRRSNSSAEICSRAIVFHLFLAGSRTEMMRTASPRCDNPGPYFALDHSDNQEARLA